MRAAALGLFHGFTAGGTQVGRYTWEYGTGNNGNVEAQTVYLTNAQTARMEYAFDGVNRLTVGIENRTTAMPSSCVDGQSTRCQGFTYDAGGNRRLTTQWQAMPAGAAPQGFAADTNRVTDTNWSYDGRGNVQMVPGLNAGKVHKYLYLPMIVSTDFFLPGQREPGSGKPASR